MSNYDTYRKEGLLINKIKKVSFIDDIKNLIKKDFSRDINYYLSLSREEFQNIAVSTQNELNEMNIQKKFYNSEKEVFEELFPGKKLLHESVVFFRAVRPMKKGIKMEAPDFHRETFYSDHSHTPHCVNLWIPVKNVDEKNTLQYYPRSHIISDDDLSVEYDENSPGKVEKFSSGHKLGFLWKPKKLSNKEILGKPKKMLFKSYSYAMFSSMLIHGGSVNLSNSIRFAVGFGLIPENKMTYNKKFFASGGKPHYVPFS